MPKPNILVIHTDQHRWDCLGAYGNKDIKTPNIDALAADGVLYTNAFCSFPACTPSRYSLLCGLNLHQHQGWSNHCTLNVTIPTFPKELREAGYKTAAVGKMHLTPTYLDVGFDTMLLAEQDGPGRFDDDYHRWLMEKGLCDVNDIEDQRGEYRKEADEEYWASRGALTSNLSEEYHSTTWIGDRALDIVNTWGDFPSLLMIGFIKPHHPFDPPEPWDSMYNPDSLSILPGWSDKNLPGDLDYNKGYFDHEELTEKKLRKVMSYYYATISQIDFQIGRIIKVLKEKEIYDNTMIIFTSDHGDYMGFHHLLLKSNLMYDPVVRVPLIIKYPNNPASGTSEDGLTSNVDIAPTILETAGIEVPRGMNGVNLAETPNANRFVVTEGGKSSFMIRTAKDKLLYHKNPDHCRYFDLEGDPLEFENKYNDESFKVRIAELKSMLGDWMLFDNPTPTHLDYDAPVISGREDYRDHERVAEYYRKKMSR